MKKFAKAAALAFAGVMAMQTAALADFADMPDGEIGVAMQAAVDNGLIGGYEDGTIRPNDYITRAQMATIIVRAMGAVDNSAKTFPDVADGAWYADAVSKAVQMGAFAGDTEGKFNPENNITCQETYTVLSRVFAFESYTLNYSNGKTGYASKADPSCLNTFADKDSVAGWATDYAAAIVGNGGFKGFSGQLKGGDMITRGEFAYLMNELIGTYIDTPGTYAQGTIDGSKSVVVRAGGVSIDGLKTDKNLIIAYSADTNGVQVTNSEVTGVTAVMGCADSAAKAANDTGSMTSYISLSGVFDDVRVCAPYIYLNVAGAKMKYLKGTDHSKINMGTYGG